MRQPKTSVHDRFHSIMRRPARSPRLHAFPSTFHAVIIALMVDCGTRWAGVVHFPDYTRDDASVSASTGGRDERRPQQNMAGTKRARHGWSARYLPNSPHFGTHNAIGRTRAVDRCVGDRTEQSRGMHDRAPRYDGAERAAAHRASGKNWR